MFLEGERPGRKRSGSTAGPGQVFLEGERPVRDQGGIKAGPRRDHILFHPILTDYQLLLFSCILSSYRHLYYISHPRYSASDWGRSLVLAEPRPPTRLPALSSCEGSCEGSCERGFLQGLLRALPLGLLRGLLLSLLGIILVETLPACCLFFYLR